MQIADQKAFTLIVHMRCLSKLVALKQWTRRGRTYGETPRAAGGYRITESARAPLTEL